MISTKPLVLYVSVLLVILCFAFLSSPRASADRPVLSQDQGYVALQQELQKLRTTARLMQTTAHPDDEDGGMLTFQSRGKGASALLCTLTRGQGGQNKSGDAFSDQLGVLRTLELLAADQYYGVEQRFSRVADFGFSKTPEETFEKWGGHRVAMADLVRVIRTFRPDVLTARFSGTSRDGHAHHQASAIITREAFRAAGDPNQFPEQIAHGLLPWQPKKLYTGNVRDSDNPTVRFDTGTYSPLLGMSFAQFAVEGLARQTSQGTGGFRLPSGHRFTYYKRVDSVLPVTSLRDQEEDFFDGIDITLPGLASRLGADESKVQFLRPGLQQLATLVATATQKATPEDASAAGAPLLDGVKLTSDLLNRVEQSQLTPAEKLELETNLRTKESQFERAANLALGVLLEVSVDPPEGGQQGFFRLEQTFQTAVPGQTFTLTARFYDRGKQDLTPEQIALDLPRDYKSEIVKSDLKPLHSGDVDSVQFRVTVPEDAQFIAPYWHRKDAYRESVDEIATPAYETLPLPPWPVQAHAIYGAASGKGTVHAIAMVKYIDPVTGQGQRELPIAPPISVEFANASQLVRTDATGAMQVAVKVRSQVTNAADASVHLDAPQGWSITPPAQQVHFTHEGDLAEVQFAVKPNINHEAHYDVTAVGDYSGKQYKIGFNTITRADLDTFYYYRPSILDVSAVNVRLPAKLKVGYIMGAGDEILPRLRQLGIDAEIISAQELATGDLSRFHTIVIGIRAYDVRTDVRTYNPRLLDFVSRGGTLVVQYNQSSGAFNSGHYTPYPITASNARVSVEEAPVSMLDPQSPMLNAPNKIGASDFDGWVQERGLYFMSDWDEHFHPLLACNDPGEAAQKGGLLVAQYGKGTYIYTGYAFFRQLPAGVPGAIRLFVNLISADTSGANAIGNAAR